MNAPIHIAAQKGHLDIVKLLMESSENINAPNILGMTPVDIARSNGHMDIVKELTKKRLRTIYYSNKPKALN